MREVVGFRPFLKRRGSMWCLPPAQHCSLGSSAAGPLTLPLLPQRASPSLSIPAAWQRTLMHSVALSWQVKKTMEATLQTIQDIVTVEDFDVSDCFQYSNSMESVKSTVSETFMSKPSIAKRRANQQETEQFYFTVRGSAPFKDLL